MNQHVSARRRDKGPKGRPLDDTALFEVSALLEGREKKRDLLIEFLHLIQDTYGCLSAAHMRALAELMRLSQAEIYEVASFYDHFDIVKEGEASPAPLTIRVCDSLSCMLGGAEDLISLLHEGVDPALIRVLRAPCMGRCGTAPAARIGNREVDSATADLLLSLARDGGFDVGVPEYVPLHAYQEYGGYAVFQRVRDGEISAESLIETLSDAGLRGLGGAGFPAGRKWQIVRSFAGPRLMTVNGDEGNRARSRTGSCSKPIRTGPWRAP